VKKKYLRLKPDNQSPWCIVSFDPMCLWDGNFSEMMPGDKFIVECIEMTEEEAENLPEFTGW